ncbi:hypothetical protein AB1L12_04570 [Peribacillus frigoritolerans]|uniref:hypothetical protein n=1 Tax=Peribacillus frigoritolerans TaxID=450367 RepID=UPI0039A1AB18
MNKKLVALSFFKGNKINYYLDGLYIYFPCFKCQQKSFMNCLDTRWKCEKCCEQGSLRHLIEFIEENPLDTVKNYKIYNPGQKIKEINKLFSSLIRKKNDEKINNKIKLLQNEVNYLIKFLK